MTEIQSPSGIDLHPDPPATVRISKRAGLVALLALASVVGLILLGMYSSKSMSRFTLTLNVPP
jgi:hypothetical protein